MAQTAFFKYKIHHLLFWILVLAVWYFLRYQDYSTGRVAFYVTLIKVIDLAILVCITNYVLIPGLLYRKQYISFSVCFVLMIVASSLLKMFILAKVMNAPALLNFSHDLKTRIYDNVIPHFFLVTAGAAIRLMVDYFHLQQRMMETAKEKAEAELNFLKSQINPHFLFNSINSVYFLIDKQNSEARESLHKFSGMLRYQLYEVNGSRVPVEKELRYLEDYVHLQKLRKDGQYEVYFSYTPAVTGFFIEPLLLIPFVENAFKHVSAFAGKANFIRLSLDHKNGLLLFSIENSREEKSQVDGFGGIGLKNVRRRLELLYPGKHHLKIEKTDELYRVSLRLHTTQPDRSHSPHKSPL